VQGIGNICILSANHSNPSITNCLVANRYCLHKASYSNFIPKIGCHGNVPQHLWAPSKMTPTAHPSPQPQRHLDRFNRFFTDDRRASLYFTMGRPFPPQNCPFPWGMWTPIYYMVPWAFSSPQPKRYLDQFSHFCRAYYCDRPTDHATQSVTIGRIYLRSTLMQPNNNKWSK